MAESAIHIDKNELKQIVRDLDKLFPDSDTKLRNTLRSAMRKAATPLRDELRTIIKREIDDKDNSTGKSARSIGIINGKTKGGRKPSIYIGPRFKGKWAQKANSVFYFYFQEYGFRNKTPKRTLDKAAKSKGTQVMASTIVNLKEIIAKRWAKKLG